MAAKERSCANCLAKKNISVQAITLSVCVTFLEREGKLRQGAGA
jgi:hypothetical protein